MFLEFGLRLQNILGVFKLVVSVLVTGSDFLSLLRVSVGEEYDQPNNYTRQRFWQGSNLAPTRV